MQFLIKMKLTKFENTVFFCALWGRYTCSQRFIG